MGDAILRFIVAGDIPGTEVQMGYGSSVAFASIVTTLSLVYVIVGQRRRVSRIMKYAQPKPQIDLITL